MTIDIFIILLSIIFSAFFSGMEIAFVAANRLRIQLEKKQGVFQARIISIFINKSSQYIATMLVGNNVALVIYGLFMAKVLKPVIETYFSSAMTILLIQTIISTMIILITAEFLPKAIFRNNPNRALNIFAIPIFVFYFCLYPIAAFTNRLSNFLIKKTLRVKISNTKRDEAFGKIDLDNFILESQKSGETNDQIQHNIKIFKNALDFSKVKIRECIVPRNEIIALEVNQSVDELRKRFIETGYSKIPVFESTIDNVIGYVHSSELFKKPKTIKSKLISLPIIPETMPANKLLNTFIRQRKSIALVVDEYGGTAGIVTLEDIVEEIFGEIEDEHDSIDLVEQKVSDNEFILSARFEIDYINEKYEINLPTSDEYETLAGLIFFHHENLPEKEQHITIENFEFRIINVSQTRIELVNLTVLPKEQMK